MKIPLQSITLSDFPICCNSILCLQIFAICLCTLSILFIDKEWWAVPQMPESKPGFSLSKGRLIIMKYQYTNNIINKNRYQNRCSRVTMLEQEGWTRWSHCGPFQLYPSCDFVTQQNLYCYVVLEKAWKNPGIAVLHTTVSPEVRRQ